MKEHVQKTGVRKYAGDDLIELQAEPLGALQGFFEVYGNCIIKGVEVAQAGDLYNVSPGLVALAGTDADGAGTFKVVPFAGAENVTLPLYLTLTYSVVTRVYGDGKVKPIAYDYRAAVSTIRPVAPFLEITFDGGKRFVDAIGITNKLDKGGDGKDVTATFAQAADRTNLASGEKLSALFGKIQKWFFDLKAVAFSGKASDLTEDTTHRFTTDAEKTGWNDKYTTSQTDAKDTATLLAAQTHTAQKIAEIVNGSPEALDTLWELAKALGNDPNFATTVMNAIGTKADTAHNHTIANVANLKNELDGKAAKNGNSTESFTANAFFANKMNVSFNRPPSSGIEMLSSITDGIESSPNKYSSALSVLSSYVGFQIGTYGGDTEDLRFRKRSDITTNPWTTWREIWHSGNFSPGNFRKEVASYNVNNIDPNTVTEGLILTEHTNAPTPTGAWYVQTFFYINLGGSSCMQIATQYTNGNNMYIRNRYAKGEWSPWERIAKSGEVQGQLNLKANAADLKTVATTGSYNDLTDKPNPLQNLSIRCAGYIAGDGTVNCRWGTNNFSVAKQGDTRIITHNLSTPMLGFIATPEFGRIEHKLTDLRTLTVTIKKDPGVLGNPAFTFVLFDLPTLG